MCLLIISSPISGSKFGRWASTSHLVSFGPSSSGSIQLGTIADSAPSQRSALKLTKTSQYHYILVLNSNSAKLTKKGGSKLVLDHKVMTNALLISLSLVICFCSEKKNFVVCCLFDLYNNALLFSRFYFDFSATYVGVGMICPYIVNVSLLLGGIISWGVMWPLISTKKGSWYSDSLPDSSLHGLNGYKVNTWPY